jgi:hypothetical protein
LGQELIRRKQGQKLRGGSADDTQYNVGARDGYIDGMNADAVGSTASVATVAGDPGALVGLSAGKYYSAADTIDVTLVGEVPGNLVCRVWALVVDAS